MIKEIKLFGTDSVAVSYSDNNEYYQYLFSIFNHIFNDVDNKCTHECLEIEKDPINWLTVLKRRIRYEYCN